MSKGLKGEGDICQRGGGHFVFGADHPVCVGIGMTLYFVEDIS